MANDKRFIAKNGLQAQNILLVDSDSNNAISMNMLTNDVLSFSGNNGQLFSISDNMSGTIFAVNDISGVPSIEVDDDGTIRLAETFGNVLIGTANNGADKLQINGNVSISGRISANSIVGPLSGNANTATAWQTPRTITIGSTGKSVDGSANVSWSLTEIGAPSTSGVGATGTWGINISGTAAVANTSVTQAKGVINTTIATTAYAASLFRTSSTGGTLDWNDPTNTIPGAGFTLLYGNANNGPTGTATYFHPLNIEYGTTGNVTQLAVAYGNLANELYMRGKFSGSWTGWSRYLNSGNYNSFVPTLTGTGASGTWNISVNGNANTATILQTARTISLGGDLSGSASFNGSSDITITATVAANSVALGVDTTGNYVATIAGTANEIEVTGSGTETAAVTIGLPDSVTITNDLTVGRNLTITGNLVVTGNTTIINANNLAIEDNLIYLNEGSLITNPDLGIVGNYNDGAYTHTGIFRDATDNRWKFFKRYDPEPDASIDTAHASFVYGDVQANNFYASAFTGALVGNASTATTLQTARTIGDVSFNGSASIVPSRIDYKDTRAVDFAPYTYSGTTLHLKNNGTDGITDGGAYHGVLNMQHWSDSSGGKVHQLAFTDNNNAFMRVSSNTSTWDSWVKLYDTSDASANTVANSLVLRDSNGSFSANTITAAISGNATTATTLQTARTIWGQSFDGSANVTGNLTSVGNITGSAGINIATTGANALSFQTNGSEKLNIDSTGYMYLTGTQFINSTGAPDGYPVFSSYAQKTATANDSSTVTGAEVLSNLYTGAFNSTGEVRGIYSTTQGSGLAGTNVSTLLGISSYVAETGSGTVTNAIGFDSTYYGTIENYYGFRQNPISFGSANNSYGFYSNLSVGANTFNFYAASSAKNYFAGRVGVGNTAPTSPLHVTSAATSSGVVYVKDTSAAAYTAPVGIKLQKDGTLASQVSPTLEFEVGTGGGQARLYTTRLAGNGGTLIVETDNTSGTSVERMRIDSSGYVGIGATSPSNKLHLTDTSANTSTVLYPLRIERETNLIPTNGIGVGIQFSTETDNASAYRIGSTIESVATDVTLNNEDFDLVFKNMTAGAAASEKMRITSTGDVGIGNTAPSYKLHVTGTVAATDFDTLSDRNLKENIVNIDNALEKVNQINGVYFNFKNDPSRRHAGVIAQEIEAVLPEVISKSNEGILSVGYGNIVGLLIEAIKEQQKQIDELKSIILNK